MAVKDYLRNRFMPHLWCAGCGHGIVLGSLLRAIESLALEKNQIAMVSGIGCSSRITGYVDFHTLHTLHGRALAFATGLKLSRPELTVIVPMGDGDALAIGGNHFIHAARRNVALTAIVMNNQTYGMTGGQFSPLSDCGISATTAPYGTIDQPFDTVALARAAGASFVARTTTWHVREMTRIFREAIRHKGFAVVEVMSQCPTYHGRRNRLGDAAEMLESFKTHAVPVGKAGAAAGALPEAVGLPEAGGGFEIGIFVQESRPEYCAEYDSLVQKARSAAGAKGEKGAAGAAAKAAPAAPSAPGAPSAEGPGMAAPSAGKGTA